MMVSHIKKPILLFNFLIILLSIISFITYSSINFSQTISHELLNSNFHDLLFTSHFNDHHETHNIHSGTNDEASDHVHTHRHSENETEHSHKHVNFVSLPEIVINKIHYIEFHPTDINTTAYLTYNIKSYDSYILETLKPPILC